MTQLQKDAALFETAPPPHDSLGLLDYLMVGAYLLITIGIVWFSSRGQKDNEDFFLGGRRLPWFAVGLSIMATLLSTISYLGIPGEVIKHGVAILWMYLAFPLSMMVVLPFFIPFFMRLKMTSAYEYLEHRFDYRARLLASVLFFWLRLGWIAMVMYAGSMAISRMTDQDLYTVVAVMGIAATAYACFGGMTAVVWTDVLQAVMLLGGAAVIVVYVWATTGAGPSDWWEVVAKHSQGHTSPPIFSFDPRERTVIMWVVINGFFWQICTHASDQVVLQRYFATTSLKAARNSYIVNMSTALLVGILLGLAGFALLFFYQQHPSYLKQGLSPSKGDEIMPYFYAHQLPLGCGGLVLANFLCDAMQTLVSGVNSIAAVVTDDLLGRMKQRPRTESEKLATTRRLTLGLGLLATCVALLISWLSQHSGKNIIDLMPRTFNMFLGPLASLFLVGMFNARATGRSAFAGVLVAMTASVSWSYFGQLSRTGIDLSPQWAIVVPCLSGVLTAFVASRVFDRDVEHPGRAFSWWNVMRRSET